MNSTPLDALLTKLCSGDDEAASQVFKQYEPYLRKVVRRLLPERLRSKFDSVDIVQSVWTDVLQGFREAGYRFANANQLRAFLVASARNRFIDRFRQQDKWAQREENVGPLALEQVPASIQPSPSADMRADDLWQQILRLCPPEYRPVLLLKHQGMAIEDIARRTNLHPGSIRRILRNLASQISVTGPSTK